MANDSPIAAQLKAIVIRLTVARQSLKAAKEARRLKASEVGRCDGYNHETGPCFHDPSGEQCDICTQKQPFHDAYCKAAHEAGAALRAVLNAGRELVKD